MSREALEYFSCFEYETRDCISTVRHSQSENLVWQSSHFQLNLGFPFYCISPILVSSAPSFMPRLSILLLCPFLHSSYTSKKRNPTSEDYQVPSVTHTREITNNMGVRAGFIPTPALPEDKQLWTCFQKLLKQTSCGWGWLRPLGSLEEGG